MNLYFSNVPSIISSLLVICEFIYIGITIAKKKDIELWGRRIAVLVFWGLLICIVVAIRDQYHLSVQASMDSKVLPGLFTIESFQSSICCIGGAVIAFCSIVSIFFKRQEYRKIIFFILSATILCKTLIIEISRVML